MTYNFCTLFNKNYLYRGLALYYSLERQRIDFTLWILCMDDETYKIIRGLQLKNIKLISLAEFETPELLEAKKGRGLGEYCWTCASSLMWHVVQHNPEIAIVAYIDADTYFFSSPQVIYDEMSDCNILIIRHNYSVGLQYLEKQSGIYNVSLVIIKNNAEGLRCLNTWRKQCLVWCYNRYEPGKFGDQMYLDTWTKEYQGVHVLKNKGANLAPWNINRYVLSQKNQTIFIDEDQLVFYHFHSLKMYGLNKFQLYYSSYFITSHDRELIYPGYTSELQNVVATVKKQFPDFQGFDRRPAFNDNLRQVIKKIAMPFIMLKSFKQK